MLVDMLVTLKLDNFFLRCVKQCVQNNKSFVIWALCHWADQLHFHIHVRIPTGWFVQDYYLQKGIKYRGKVSVNNNVNVSSKKRSCIPMMYIRDFTDFDF